MSRLSTMSNAMVEKLLDGIKTEMLVAFIFSILAVAVLLVIFLILGIGMLPTTCPAGAVCSTNALTAPAIADDVFAFVWMVLAILVLRRTNQMRRAANEGDIPKLGRLNSIGWAIVAVIFTFVPGVMLLFAHGPIEALGAGQAAQSTASPAQSR